MAYVTWFVCLMASRSDVLQRAMMMMMMTDSRMVSVLEWHSFVPNKIVELVNVNIIL